MEIIDFHVHGGSPDRSPEIARYIAESEISAIALLSLPRPPASATPTYNAEIRTNAKQIEQSIPDFPVVTFGCLDDDVLAGSGKPAGAAAQVDGLKALGFAGVKLWEGKPELVNRLSLYPDDPRIIAVCRRASQLSMPVLFHIADPPLFWNDGGPYAGKDSIPRFSELIEAAWRLAAHVPDCLLIFPHLLFLAGDLNTASRFLDENPRCFFDLSPGNYLFADLAAMPSESRAFFSAHRQRLLFGTDGFWFASDDSLIPGDSYEGNLLRFTRLRDFLATDREFDNPFALTADSNPRIKGLKLSNEVLRPIFAGNAKRIMEAL